MIASRPKAGHQSSAPQAEIAVDVQNIQPAPLAVTIHSYGLVEALTQTNLVSRVSGEVTYVNDNFRTGGEFKEGELLLSLEKDDYQIALAVAKAQIAEAESALETEKAEAEEARYDWQRSGRKGEAPLLALRKPQLRAAEANLVAAKANVRQAELNLARTDIYAPFNGQVITLNVGLGQLVSANTALAEVFSNDAAEIKLPIKTQDYPYLPDAIQNNVPLSSDTQDATSQEATSKELSQTNDSQPQVNITFTSSLGEEQLWEGRVARVSGTIDETSRQLYVIGKISSPFTAQANKRSLKVGEYLTAEIKGKTVADAIAIPNKSIYQNTYVYVYNNGQVERRDISIGWNDSQQSMITSGLTTGDQLVLTPLGRVPTGTRVRIRGEEDKAKEAASNTIRKTDSGKPTPAHGQ